MLWGKYPLSIEPQGSKDRPQMAILARRPGGREAARGASGP